MTARLLMVLSASILLILGTITMRAKRVVQAKLSRIQVNMYPLTGCAVRRGPGTRGFREKNARCN